MTRKAATAPAVEPSPPFAAPESEPARKVRTPQVPALPGFTPLGIPERKRARRAPTVAKAEPKPEVIAIDLARMTAEQAKKALAAAYPRPIEGKIIDATDHTSRAALEYLNAHDASAIAAARKEASGNVLRHAMGDAEEIAGEGWKATWRLQKGVIDWGALAKELNIPSDVIEQYRKPEMRVLNVRETASE